MFVLKNKLFVLISALICHLCGLNAYASWTENFNSKSGNDFTLTGWTFNEDGSFYFSNDTDFNMSSRHIRSQNIPNNGAITTYTGYLFVISGTSYTTTFQHSCVCFNVNNSNAEPNIEIAYESFTTGAIVSTTGNIKSTRNQLNTASSTFTPSQTGWYRIRFRLTRQSNNGTAAVAIDNISSTIPVNAVWNDTTVPIDQALQLSTSDNDIEIGDPITFTVNYSLNGPSWFTRVKSSVFRINIPAGFTYQSHQINGFNYDAVLTTYDPNTELFTIWTNNEPPGITLTIQTIAANPQSGLFSTTYLSNNQPQTAIGGCPIPDDQDPIIVNSFMRVQNDDNTCLNPEPIAIISNSVQPIEIVSFTADATTDGNLLSWSTAYEINNDFFEIQRSPNGKDFIPIGNVDGAGNHSGSLTYGFLDVAPLQGLSYYRLRQVDFDGSSKTFHVVRAVRAKDHARRDSFILQNPVKDGRLWLKAPESECRLVIVDTKGRVVHDSIYLPQAYSGDQLKIDNLNLTQGIYIVLLHSDFTVRKGSLLVK